jgi:hypothetical protein
MKVSGFSKVQPFTPEFNENRALPEGEQLRAKLTVLTLNELIDVQDTLAKAQTKEGENPTSDQIKALLALNGPLLASHVEFVQGNDGFNVEDVTSYAHFFDLALELLKQLNKVSQPTERDVKN